MEVWEFGGLFGPRLAGGVWEIWPISHWPNKGKVIFKAGDKKRESWKKEAREEKKSWKEGLTGG